MSTVNAESIVHNQKVSTLKGQIDVLTEIVSNTYSAYNSAKSRLATDDATIAYISALTFEASTFSIYNSTTTQMLKIENQILKI